MPGEISRSHEFPDDYDPVDPYAAERERLAELAESPLADAVAMVKFAKHYEGDTDSRVRVMSENVIRMDAEIRRLREVTKLQGYSIRLHGQDCRQQQRVIEELKEDETEMLRKLSAANAQLREWKILIAELEARVAQLTINREGLLPAWQKQRESLRGRIAHLEAELSNERIDSQKWRDYCETKRD